MVSAGEVVCSCDGVEDGGADGGERFGDGRKGERDAGVARGIRAVFGGSEDEETGVGFEVPYAHSAVSRASDDFLAVKD